MATRSVAARRASLGLSFERFMDSSRGASRYLTTGQGRILSEEERAAEAVYIQKMERERMEKLRKKAEKEKAERERQGGEKVSEAAQTS